MKVSTCFRHVAKMWSFFRWRSQGLVADVVWYSLFSQGLPGKVDKRAGPE